eukprot:403347886
MLNKIQYELGVRKNLQERSQVSSKQQSRQEASRKSFQNVNHNRNESSNGQNTLFYSPHIQNDIIPQKVSNKIRYYSNKISPNQSYIETDQQSGKQREQSFFGQSPLVNSLSQNQTNLFQLRNHSVNDGSSNQNHSGSMINKKQAYLKSRNKDTNQTSIDLKKEYYRQLVDISVPGLQTKQTGPIYGFKQLGQSFAQNSSQPVTPLKKINNQELKQILNPNFINEQEQSNDGNSSKSGMFQKKNNDLTVTTIKQNYHKYLQNAFSPLSTRHPTNQNQTIQVLDGNSIAFEDPKRKSFHNLLRASFGEGKRYSEQINKFSSPDKISNDQLWKVLETYKVQQDHQKTKAELDERKQLYSKYKEDLGNQFKLQDKLANLKQQQRLQEIQAFQELEKQRLLEEENQLLNKQREKQIYKDYQIKTIYMNDQSQKHKKQLDLMLDEVLKEGPKEIIKMDEFQSEVIFKQKEQKLKDDLLNRELERQRKRAQQRDKIETQTSFQIEESFLDRLRRKDHEISLDTKNRQSKIQNLKILAASFRVDMNGEIKVNEKKTLNQLEGEAEQKALIELAKQDQEKQRQEEFMIQKQREVTLRAQQSNKEIILKKQDQSKVQKYQESKQDQLKTQGQVFATLKLPNIIAEEEFNQIRRAQKLKLSEEYKLITKEKQKQKSEIRDVEILLNKEPFQEMGLI